MSAAQNFDALFFGETAELRMEFENVFRSLFRNPTSMVRKSRTVMPYWWRNAAPRWEDDAKPDFDNVTKSDRGSFAFGSLDGLDGWESTMGLQFENLVLANLAGIAGRLGMGNAQLAMETGLWNYDAKDSYVHFLRMMLDAQRPCAKDGASVRRQTTRRSPDGATATA